MPVKQEDLSSPRVAVGIDGSRAALHAATWAIDEAVDRDIPLRLLYALDPAGGTRDGYAAAETALGEARTTIESLGRPVKLETEVVDRHPVTALLEASRAAALVCLGANGFGDSTPGRFGSTASAVANAAHCPVAVVPRTSSPASRRNGIVLAVVDGSPAGDTVLDRSLTEARLRDAPLRVFMVPSSRPPDAGDGATDDVRARRAAAELEHRFTHWRRNHPDLDIGVVTEHNGLLNYLDHLLRNSTPTQLVVVHPLHPGAIDTVSSPAGHAALEAAGCGLLVCDRQWWL